MVNTKVLGCVFGWVLVNVGGCKHLCVLMCFCTIALLGERGGVYGIVAFKR